MTISFSGFGWLTLVLLVAPWVVLGAITDNTGGEWQPALFVAACSALLALGLNLAIASANEGGGAHRLAGTAMQSYTPVFLGTAWAGFTGWLGPWVTWPVAAALFVAGIVAYAAVPALRRRPLRQAVVARRQRAAEAPGRRFLAEVPGLSGRWNLGSLTPGSAGMNPPTQRLRGHFAGMAGVHGKLPFTVVDAFTPELWAVFPRWRQRHVTVCAVHVGGNLPDLRVVRLRGRRRRVGGLPAAYEGPNPAFAAAVLTEPVVAEMIDQGLETFEFQGQDVLTLLWEPLERDDDPDERAMATVAALATVLSRIEADVTPFARSPVTPLPIPPVRA